MGYVSSETIDAVIERLNGLHEREVVALQRRLGPAQPELAAFVLAYTHDRGPDVCGFAIATTMVLLEAFRASGLKMRKARERVVERQWEASRGLLAALREDVERNVERTAGTTMTGEPAALAYVFEALTDEEMEDPLGLSMPEQQYGLTSLINELRLRVDQERLLNVAKAGTAEQVEWIVLRVRYDRRAEQQDARRQDWSRAPHVYPSEDGTATVRGRFTPEQGALLIRALDAARKTLYRREGATGNVQNVPAETFPERPTISQQRFITRSTPARPVSATRSWCMSTPRS